MSALTIMKTLFPHLFDRALRRGPFAFTLTDLHQSNILVDEDCNMKCIIDLEWACPRPIEMLQPLRWLTVQAVDEIDVHEYNKVREEFMDILAGEESFLYGQDQQQVSSIMRRGWEMGTFWYTLSLRSPTGYNHIQPRFAQKHEDDSDFFWIVMYYSTAGAMNFVFKKLDDKTQYDRQL